jgi:hypothetical protein
MTSYNPNAIFQLLVLAIFWQYCDPNAIFQLLVLAIFGNFFIAIQTPFFSFWF